MKAKPQSFQSYTKLLVFLLLSMTYGLTSGNAQCPTVDNNVQSLCNVESVLVGDLEATDNGGGIVWYATADSTTPLLNIEGLIDGEDYYADDNTGTCGTRARVDVIIYGPPIGSNFQGICLDDPTLATVADLVAIGNNVQWYSNPSGGLPLIDSTILVDEAIYYADQENPDTGCRTSRLAVRVNVGFTPIPSGDTIQEFCSSSEFTPTIDDLVASGNNNWYISFFSALALPSDTPLINGQLYYATTVDLPCESTARLGVLVILDVGPNPGTDGILDLCDTDSTPIDLISALGGSPESGGTWTPELNSGTGVFDPNTDPDGVYTYTVGSGNVCPDSSATVTVTTIVGPNAGTDGTLETCSNSASVDLFNSLGDTPDSGGTWSPTLNSSTGVFNPSIDPQGVYTYSVDGTAPCNTISATVSVSVTPFNDAGEDGTIEICNSIGTIDLFDSLQGTPDPGGTWSPLLNSATGIFDPTIDAQGTYTYSFSGNAVCPDSSAAVTITVNDLPDAGSNGLLELCSNETSSLDLFNSLGGNPDNGGVWSPALASGTGVFDPTVDSPGIYTYALTGTAPCPDASATVDVSIISEANPGLDNAIDICSNIGTINLFDSLGGTPDTGGTWSPLLNSGTGIFDPTIDPEGTYTYTILGTGPCPNASAAITISIIPFFDAGENGTLTICTNDGIVDLFDSLGGTPTAGGTWSPVLNSGTGIFDPVVDPEGTYTYSTSAGGNCSNDSATVIVSVELSPDAGNDNTITLCGTVSSIDLFDSLGGTPQPGGTWSPTLISGSGIFDPNSDPEGIYTYTISSICGNSTATITVSVDESIDAGSDGAIELCTTDSPVNLFDSLVGTPSSGGNWSPALISGTGVFDPSLDSQGTYTYTISNSATICPDTSANVIVTLLQEPDAGSDGTLNLCNANGLIDLFDSLSGTPDTGGVWSPALTSGTGVFDPNTDAEGTYTYTVNSACGTSSSTVIVSFTNLNDAGSDGSIDLCFSDSSVDLFNSLGGTPQTGGTWTPALFSGTGVFDPSIDPDGVYTYIISNNSSLCPSDLATVTVSILTEADAGTDGSLNFCDATDSVDLFDSLGGTPQTGGAWTPTLPSGTGVFDPNTDPEGIYTYTINTTCGTSSAIVTVSFSELNDAGIDGSIELCSTDTPIDLFDSLGGTPQPGGTWSPTLNSGTGIFDPSVDSADTYTYTISNSSSLCSDDSATVTVSILQVPDAGSNGTLNLCNATNTVDLLDSLAGTPDSGGTWSPTLSSGTGVFDPNLDTEGDYTYTVNTTCGSSSATVTVSFSEINDAGNDGSIDLCSDDSPIDLFDSLGGTPQPGGTWTPTLISGTGLFDPSIDSSGIYTYTISNDASLCPDASATVTVSLSQAPNAGDDSLLLVCSNDLDPINLIDFLDGAPDTGGIWSPALSSGTGVFDPSIDIEGFYTYTISSLCGDASATLFVTFTDANDAGLDGFTELCNTNVDINLFDSLGGTPQTGGLWSPALSSGTGVFNPSLDTAGAYTYTISNAASTCPTASAIVTVVILPLPNAGIDGTLNICRADTDPVDLFDSLGGTPDAEGIWSPTLTSTTGVFDPTLDAEGVYTYTVNTTCGSSSATVTVSFSEINDAGSDGLIELCSDASPVDLFNSLGGTPESGGTWTPALISGTGIFDPSLDTAGIFTYTVSNAISTCPAATASVTVSILPLPNPGIDNTLNLCTDDVDPIDLFDNLGGTPEVGGTWSPALISGTGIFDPTLDAEGIYTYTVISVECNITNQASVTVTINEIPDVSGLTMSVDERICIGSDAIVRIIGANQLANGDYTIVYTLSESNTSINTTLVTIAGGSSSFTIPENVLQNPGSTIITLSDLFFFGETCGANTELIVPITIVIIDAPTPEIIANGSEFCELDSPTIEDLTSNIINSENIIWYNQPQDGDAYDSSELLEDGLAYYASIQTEEGCESARRLVVTVSLISCVGELTIPDGFSPNNDTINDVFDILYLDDLYPNYKLSIYNRYGNTIYEGNINSPKWDGTWKGNDTVLPVGVYFYVLEFNDGERNPKQGTVYLSR